MRRVTYCRICPAICGLLLDVEDGQVTKVLGDADNLLTGGYTCVKGRRIVDFHTDPLRYRSSQRRGADGRLADIPVADAIEQIAARLQELVAEHGPDSVALIAGTQAAMTSLTGPFARAWFRTLGSQSLFSPQTIDQSAKWVTEGRLGMWAAGRQRFGDSDVWMLVGTNPLVSMQGGDITGFPIHNGSKRLAAEQRRGLKLVVVDPRRTEVAARADLHLQLVPGTDATLFAGLLRLILERGWEDRDFCASWVTGLDQLRSAVSPFTPKVVAAVCGLPADDVVRAAEHFATARRGMATTGTGPDMGPEANLAEHLVQCLNVVCGRFPREGDAQAEGGVLGAGRSRPAEVVPPDRTWERGYRGPSGHGQLRGELPIVTLPDRLTSSGPDRIRALVVVGANPASALPDQRRAAQALSELDLLVTVDPFPSDTAQLAHYVIAPVMQLERADTTRAYELLLDAPFAQYTPPVLDAPEGTVDDWEFFLRLSWAMGRSVHVAGVDYPPDGPLPTTDEVLATFVRRARVPLEDVKQHPHGKLYDEISPPRVGPATPGAAGRFDVMPPDVAAELAACLAAHSVPAPRPHLLVVRRMRETLNSTGPRLPGLPRQGGNPCFVHPDDLAALGLVPGAVVTITSDHGTLAAVVEADPTMRRGVVSMTHGFGHLPGPDALPLVHGVNVGQLASLEHDLQDISAMPVLSALPVTLTAVPA